VELLDEDEQQGAIDLISLTKPKVRLPTTSAKRSSACPFSVSLSSQFKWTERRQASKLCSRE